MTFSPPVTGTPVQPRPTRLTVLTVLVWAIEGVTLLLALWQMVMLAIQLVSPGALTPSSPQTPWMADYQREAQAAAVPLVQLPLGALQGALSAAVIWFAIQSFMGRSAGRDRFKLALMVATGFVCLKFAWALFTSYRVYGVLMKYMDQLVHVGGAGATPPPAIEETVRVTLWVSLGLGLLFTVLVFVVKLVLYLYTRHYLGSEAMNRYVSRDG